MKIKEFLKRISYKSSILYFAFIQIEVVVVSVFLSFLIVMPINFIFDEGIARDIASVLAFLTVELIFRFFIFFIFFKNNKSLNFSQFSLNYIPTFILRFIFSIATHFAMFSAGSGVCLLGSTLGVIFINPEIKTMQDVPIILYIVIFVLCEGLTIFASYLAMRLCEAQRERASKELHLE